MASIFRYASLMILLALAVEGASAQVTVGIPPFISTGGGPEVINLANLNAHYTIPIVHKAGRGLPFTFDLTYDSSIWYPVTANGKTSWEPASAWGWDASEVDVGMVTAQSRYATNQYGYSFTYTNWQYTDGYGTSHYLGPVSAYYNYSYKTGCTGSGFSNAIATDDSGYKLTVSYNSCGVYVSLLTSRDGNIINAGCNVCSGGGSSPSFQDRNGNEITVSFAGGTSTFTDTLGATALTISGTNPVDYNYTPASNTNVSVQVNYTSYTVATNFGAPNISEFGATAESLVSSVVYPDGSQYTFSYEPTPSIPSTGACTPLSGTYAANCVTARIKSVTFPAGGNITYAYTGGYNGIFSDGSAAGFTRQTPDGT